jgi:type I restriction enzyme S subunit
MTWPPVGIGEVLELDLDKVAVDPSVTYPMVGVLSFGRGLFQREPVQGAGTSYRHFYRLKARHIVLSQLFGWEGALALSDPRFEGAFVSPQFPTFSCDERRLHREFFGWYIRRKRFWESLGARAVGMGDRRRTLNPDALLGLEMPLPSLSEQRRITARIEVMASGLADARRLREQSRTECGALGTAVLTKDYERLAEAYPVRALGEVSLDISDGPHKTPSYVDAGVPFVTVRNMVSGTLDFRGVQYITPEDHRLFSRRSRAEKGDVLYSKDGATRGRPCFVRTDEPFSFFVSVALIKPRRDLLDGRYLCHLLDSGWIRDRMRLRSRGDMIPHIVLSEIRKFPVPLPPLAEQRSIVDRLDAVEAGIERLKGLQERTAAKIDALMNSVLDKAFRGEL